MYKVLISHRGNLNGRVPESENTKEFIQAAIDSGFDVEVDVRRIDTHPMLPPSLSLGHDAPEHPVELPWLIARKDRLWIHAKNFGALSYLLDFDLRIFYHQVEAHTIISNCGLIWSHDISEAGTKSIIPLLDLDSVQSYDNKPVYGICSDFVMALKDR
jgi:hypothetical protein